MYSQFCPIEWLTSRVDIELQNISFYMSILYAGYNCCFFMIDSFSKKTLLPSLILGSIVVSIPACHAGDRGSIPRRGDLVFFLTYGLIEKFYNSRQLNRSRKVKMIIRCKKCLHSVDLLPNDF